MSKDQNRRLTGDHVKLIRKTLKESQADFGKRLDVSQPVIVRLEKKGATEIYGPEKILILQIADKNKISIDGDPAAADDAGQKSD